MAYLIGTVTAAAIYAILALGYNFQLGQAGIFSIAHGAFYGVGAYVAALLCIDYNTNFWLTLAAGAAGAGVVSILLGLLGLRVSGDYLVVSSFAFQLIILAVIVNWPSVTKGSIGVLGVLPPVWASNTTTFMWLCIAAAAVVALICASIAFSPYGLALRASRDDPLAAASLGKRVALLRLSIFVFSSGLAGLAGGLYAYYQGFISPDSFQVSVSIIVLSMVVLGGLGRISGAILGAIVLVALPQVIGLIPIPDTVLGPIQQMIYGAVLVAIVIIRPQGLLGSIRLRFPGQQETQANPEFPADQPTIEALS
jgi:branched-chain amino acid transport system permease protein